MGGWKAQEEEGEGRGGGGERDAFDVLGDRRRGGKGTTGQGDEPTLSTRPSEAPDEDEGCLMTFNHTHQSGILPSPGCWFGGKGEGGGVGVDALDQRPAGWGAALCRIIMDQSDARVSRMCRTAGVIEVEECRRVNDQVHCVARWHCTVERWDSDHCDLVARCPHGTSLSR